MVLYHTFMCIRNVLKIWHFALKILKEDQTYMHDYTGSLIFPTQYQIIHLYIRYLPETIYSLTSQLNKLLCCDGFLIKKFKLLAGFCL
jgi:hypothetical protein